MKTAIVTDYLNQFGGAEKVTQEIARLLPESDIYTIFAKEAVVDEYFSDYNVYEHPKFKTSKFRQKHYRKLLPFYPTYIEDFDFRGYDLVVSSSYLWAKGILCRPDTMHISYVHTPMRQAWVKYHEYLYQENDIGRLTRPILRYVMNYIRIWDVISSHRVDHFIANSSVVADRIENIYRRPSEIIHPPITVNHLKEHISEVTEDYYVTVGRLVPYKRVDIMIEAFNALPQKKLLILGDGNDRERLESMITSPNIEMKGFVSEEEKINILSKAKGFLFCAEEDFGMSPVEALAIGVPLIGYQRGGTRDYLIDNVNGIKFDEQTADSLIEAIEEFEHIGFEKRKIVESAAKFGLSNFRTKLADFINGKVGFSLCSPDRQVV